MIVYLKTVNVGGLSFQLRCELREGKDPPYNTFEYNDTILYNTMLLTSDEYNDPARFKLAFYILKELNSENDDAMYEVCESIEHDSDCVIDVCFIYYDSLEDTLKEVNYTLVYNRKGIKDELIDGKSIREGNRVTKYFSVAPTRVTDYFNNITMFDFKDDWKCRKYYKITKEMVHVSNSYKAYVAEYLSYLGYILEDFKFVPETGDLSVKYQYFDSYVSADDDEELMKILGFAAAAYSAFINSGVVYVSNSMEAINRTLLASFIEMVTANRKLDYKEDSKCQFMIEENHTFLKHIETFRVSDRFDGEEIFDESQILKIVDYEKKPLVEWVT